jgi:hypothetical protein
MCRFCSALDSRESANPAADHVKIRVSEIGTSVMYGRLTSSLQGTDQRRCISVNGLAARGIKLALLRVTSSLILSFPLFFPKKVTRVLFHGSEEKEALIYQNGSHHGECPAVSHSEKLLHAGSVRDSSF